MWSGRRAARAPADRRARSTETSARARARARAYRPCAAPRRAARGIRRPRRRSTAAGRRSARRCSWRCPALGDEGEDDVVLRRAGAELLAQTDERVVQAQLQDGPDAPAGLGLELLQGIQVPRVDDQRFFANGIGTDPEGQAAMGVMEVVRRADGEAVHALGVAEAAELLDVPLETLELGEEADVERVAVERAGGIGRIERRDDGVARLVDGLEMARRDIAGGSGDGEVLGHRTSATVVSRREMEVKAASPPGGRRAASIDAIHRNIRLPA